MRTPRLVVAAVTIAALGAAVPSFAASGSGGGGGGGTGGGGGGTTTVKNGAIRPVAVAVTCDGTSVWGVSLRKGFDSRVEGQFTPSGPDLSSGRWAVRLHAVDIDKPLGGFGSDIIPGSVITNLFAGVPVGTHTIRVTAVRSSPNDQILDPTAVAIETCSGEAVVVAR